MRYPKPLNKYDTIGFVAPSFGCVREPYHTAFLSALKRFQAKGYKTALGPNCFASNGIGISNTPQACGQELTAYYVSEGNQALISCGGGELMCETLPYIDFEQIRKADPKWYMGYSDNTNFTFLSATLCDTAAIYGPNAPAFGMKPWHASLRDAFALMNGQLDQVHNYPLWEKESLKDAEHPLLPYHVTEPMVIRKWLPKEQEQIRFQGRLIGGCMDCLVNLLGTEFDHVREFQEKYQEDGFIWFLESCDLSVLGIRRAVWQMKHAGWFDHVKGFLIGRPYCFGEEVMGLDQYEAVLGELRHYQVPVLMDLDIGHLAPMMPIVIGAMAEVNCCGSNLDIKYEWK